MKYQMLSAWSDLLGVHKNVNHKLRELCYVQTFSWQKKIAGPWYFTPGFTPGDVYRQGKEKLEGGLHLGTYKQEKEKLEGGL